MCIIYSHYHFHLPLFVTGFVKRGLSHTANLPTLMTCTLGLVKAKFGQQEALAYFNKWRTFQLNMCFDNQGMVFIELNACGRPKSGHI